MQVPLTPPLPQAERREAVEPKAVFLICHIHCSSEECVCVRVSDPHPVSRYLSLLSTTAHLFNRLQPENSIPKSMSPSLNVCALSGAWAPEGGLLLTQPQLPGHMLILQSASSFTHNFICNGLAGSSPVWGPVLPLIFSPLWPRPLLPLAVVCLMEQLLSGNSPEHWTQRDTCPGLLIFFNQHS